MLSTSRPEQIHALIRSSFVELFGLVDHVKRATGHLTCAEDSRSGRTVSGRERATGRPAEA